jgi:hypothetical protein
MVTARFQFLPPRCFVPIRYSLLALLAIVPALAADDLIALNGKNISGSIAAITNTDVTMKTDAGPVATPMAQVLAINLRNVKPLDPAAKYTDVHLLDDTVIHCKDVEFQGKDVALSLFSGTVLKVPLASIITVVRDGQNRILARKFEDVAGKKLKRDRIVILRDGDLNVLEGTLGEVNAKDKTVQFKSEVNGTLVNIPLERLHGMVFYRPDVAAEPAMCKVLDVDGNMLIAAKLAHDGTKLVMTTTLGHQLTLPAEVLAKLDFNMGKLTYLSDLEPAKVVEKSGIGLVNRFRRDVNLDGEPIILEGNTHAKGLSLHAYTELEYNLAGKFKDFKAILGVDVRTGSDSQAKVAIYCDGAEVFSETITPGKVRPLALNVKDVTTLRIVVRSRDFLDLHDHVTFADARVNQ